MVASSEIVVEIRNLLKKQSQDLIGQTVDGVCCGKKTLVSAEDLCD